MTFWVCTILTLLRLPLVLWGFTEERFSDVMLVETGESKVADKKAWEWLFFFGACILMFQLTNATYTLTFYPIIINDWHFSQSSVSLVMLGIILLSIIPPLSMAVLSQRLGIQDRTILLIGIAGSVLPSVLFSYPTGHLWNILVGGCFAVVFSTVIGPTINTLFSKKVGTQNASGLKVGLLIAAQSTGNAIGSLLGDVALRDFGTYAFMYWNSPLIATTLLVIFFFQYLSWTAPQKDVSFDPESSQESEPLITHRTLYDSIDSHKSTSYIINEGD